MSSSTEEESNSRGILVSENLRSFASLTKGGSGGNLRRTRQRVDAGEPRNSYASIPNFSSRPTSQQLLVPSSVGGFAVGGINGDVVGYNVTNNRMLSSSPLGTKVSLLANSESGDSETSGDYQRQSDEFVSNGNMKDINNQPLSLVTMATGEDKSVLLREILQSGNNNNNNKENIGKSNLITHLLKHNNSLNGDDDEEDDEETSENYAEEDMEDRSVSNIDTSKNAACDLTVMCDDDDEDDDRREISEEYEGGDEDEEIEDDEDVDRKDKSSKNNSAQFRNDGQLNGEMMEDAATPLSQAMYKDDDDDEEEMEEEDEETKLHLRVKSPISNDSKVSISASLVDLSGGIASIANVMNNNTSTADIKRARVENIISSISGISPSRVSSNDTAVQPVNGCKKRKLYQPQQHEASRTSFRHEYSDYEDVEVIDMQKRLRNVHNNGDIASCVANAAAVDDFLSAKRAKLSVGGQEFWKEQVSEMQAQIAAIQKKLTDLYDVHSPDTDGPITSAVTTSVGNDDIKEIAIGKVQIGTKSNGRPLSNLISNHNLLLQLGHLSNPERSRIASKSPIISDILDPIHFIDEARRLVHEQERLAKMEASSTTPANSVHQLLTSTPAEPKVAATAAVATASCHQPGSSHCNRIMSPDWEVLADNLKAGMSNLIDDWVRRCSSSASTIAAKNRTNSVINNTSNISTAQELSSSLHSNRTPIINMSDSLKELANANHHHHQQLHHQHGGSATTSPSVMIATSTGALGSGGSLHLSDRKSPRTKVIDRGRQGGISSIGGGGSITSGLSPSANAMAVTAAAIMNSSNHNFGDFHSLKPPTMFPHPLPIPPPPPLPTSQASKVLSSLYVGHQSQLPFYGHLAAAAAAAAASVGNMNGNGCGDENMYNESSEQSGPLSLVMTPKKKRSKVTDKVPARSLNRQFIQTDVMESTGGSGKMMLSGGPGGGRGSPMDYHHNSSSIVPVSLPTSVAIPNPSLVHQSDIFSPYPYYHPAPPPLPHALPSLTQSTRGAIRTGTRSPSPSESANDEIYSRHSHQGLRPSLLAMQGGAGGNTSPDLNMKENGGDSSECNSNDMSYDGIIPTSSTLTPMHLRKAKLMFFFVRYPSSSILKAYFPDIKFNKNNTAQLVKWFSNFREFYYIQMEKYARQAMSEGVKCAEDLVVTMDSELYRILNLHYNRNNHIEVPVNFRYVVEQTLREFFKAVSTGKDSEQSWKKAIYKVIARLDDNLPEYFKSPNFLEQLE